MSLTSLMWPSQGLHNIRRLDKNKWLSPSQGSMSIAALVSPPEIEGLGDGNFVEFNGVIPNRIENFSYNSNTRLIGSTNHEGFQWSRNNEEGNFFYIYDTTNDVFNQYDCPTPYDFINATQTVFRNHISSLTELDFGWSDDGVFFFILDVSGLDIRITKSSVITPWIINPVSAPSLGDFIFVGIVVTAFVFSNGGFRLFVLDSIAKEILQYNLTTAFDVRNTSMSFSGKKFSLPGIIAVPKNVRVSSDGLHLFVSDRGSEVICRFDIKTANEIDTTDPTQHTLDISAEGDFIVGFDLVDSDKLKLHLVNDDPAPGSAIYEYEAVTVQEPVEVIQ